MSNSMIVAPRPAVRKATKKERRRNKQRRFVVMASRAFIILFILSICITVVVASIGATDASNNGETEKGDNTPNNGNYIIVTTVTHNEVEIKPIKMEKPEINKEIKPETEKSKETKTEIIDVAIEEKTDATEETTAPTEETKSYTEDDLYYLAAAVCSEAGGESEKIQLLVANVIINRVNSSHYPNTIYKVLTQYKQYGKMWKYGVSFPNWADKKTIDQCYSVAKRILEGERFCPENVLFQAEFKQGSGVFKQFGNDYYFCYY